MKKIPIDMKVFDNILSELSELRKENKDLSESLKNIISPFAEALMKKQIKIESLEKRIKSLKENAR